MHKSWRILVVQYLIRQKQWLFMVVVRVVIYIWCLAFQEFGPKQRNTQSSKVKADITTLPMGLFDTPFSSSSIAFNTYKFTESIDGN